MCQMTASFARTRSYSLAVSLLAIAAIGTPGLAAAASRPDFGYLESDGSDTASTDHALAAEAFADSAFESIGSSFGAAPEPIGG